MRSFKIITFGCRVNQAESREIGEKLTALGLRPTQNNPDLVIINTCCVTRKAEREVRKEIRKVKRENPDCFLAVCGCWVNKLKTQNANVPGLAKAKPRAGKTTTQSSKLFDLMDLLISNEDKKNITKVLKKYFSNLAIKQLSNRIYQDKYAKSGKALIKIQDGCDNFCTYCIVPYVRGRSRSKSADKIIKEIKRKVREGIGKVVLTGIDLSDYNLRDYTSVTAKYNFQFSIFNLFAFSEEIFGKAKHFQNNIKNDLVKLIKLILAETKIKKIGFGSMNIRIFDKDFLALYQDKNLASRLTRHFHIPLQSGCNKTLKRMGRKYKISNVKFLISKLKEKIPGFTFSTDIIVGFPGEAKEEFQESLKTLKEIKKILGKDFIKIHIFRYSPRERTLAAEMKEKWGRVAEEEKKRRAAQVARLVRI